MTKYTGNENHTTSYILELHFYYWQQLHLKWLVIPTYGQVSNPLKLVPNVNGKTGL